MDGFEANPAIGIFWKLRIVRNIIENLELTDKKLSQRRQLKSLSYLNKSA